jgi:hypothetical protein
VLGVRLVDVGRNTLRLLKALLRFKEGKEYVFGSKTTVLYLRRLLYVPSGGSEEEQAQMSSHERESIALSIEVLPRVFELLQKMSIRKANHEMMVAHGNLIQPTLKIMEVALTVRAYVDRLLSGVGYEEWRTELTGVLRGAVDELVAVEERHGRAGTTARTLGICCVVSV